jgi:hypothetical protein
MEEQRQGGRLGADRRGTEGDPFDQSLGGVDCLTRARLNRKRRTT